MTPAPVVVRGLGKSFFDESRGEVRAVDGLEFEAAAGEIFGLLGVNGAGKTTTLRMLANATVAPDSIDRFGFYNMENALHVGRPAMGQPQSTVGLFRLVKGTNEAVRVRVRLGQASVSTIEILDGLDVGDEVILSDTSAWDSTDRIRLN
mgnify:CR=1 FL=1